MSNFAPTIPQFKPVMIPKISIPTSTTQPNKQPIKQVDRQSTQSNQATPVTSQSPSLSATQQAKSITTFTPIASPVVKLSQSTPSSTISHNSTSNVPMLPTIPIVKATPTKPIIIIPTPVTTNVSTTTPQSFVPSLPKIPTFKQPTTLPRTAATTIQFTNDSSMKPSPTQVPIIKQPTIFTQRPTSLSSSSNISVPKLNPPDTIPFPPRPQPSVSQSGFTAVTPIAIPAVPLSFSNSTLSKFPITTATPTTTTTNNTPTLPPPVLTIPTISTFKPLSTGTPVILPSSSSQTSTSPHKISIPTLPPVITPRPITTPIFTAPKVTFLSSNLNTTSNQVSSTTTTQPKPFVFSPPTSFLVPQVKISIPTVVQSDNSPKTVNSPTPLACPEIPPHVVQTIPESHAQKQEEKQVEIAPPIIQSSPSSISSPHQKEAYLTQLGKEPSPQQHQEVSEQHDKQQRDQYQPSTTLFTTINTTLPRDHPLVQPLPINITQKNLSSRQFTPHTRRLYNNLSKRIVFTIKTINFLDALNLFQQLSNLLDNFTIENYTAMIGDNLDLGAMCNNQDVQEDSNMAFLSSAANDDPILASIIHRITIFKAIGDILATLPLAVLFPHVYPLIHLMTNLTPATKQGQSTLAVTSPGDIADIFNRYMANDKNQTGLTPIERSYDPNYLNTLTQLWSTIISPSLERLAKARLTFFADILYVISQSFHIHPTSDDDMTTQAYSNIYLPLANNPYAILPLPSIIHSLMYNSYPLHSLIPLCLGQAQFDKTLGISPNDLQLEQQITAQWLELVSHSSSFQHYSNDNPIPPSSNLETLLSSSASPSSASHSTQVSISTIIHTSRIQSLFLAAELFCLIDSGIQTFLFSNPSVENLFSHTQFYLQLHENGDLEREQHYWTHGGENPGIVTNNGVELTLLTQTSLQHLLTQFPAIYQPIQKEFDRFDQVVMLGTALSSSNPISLLDQCTTITDEINLLTNNEYSLYTSESNDGDIIPSEDIGDNDINVPTKWRSTSIFKKVPITTILDVIYTIMRNAVNNMITNCLIIPLIRPCLDTMTSHHSLNMAYQMATQAENGVRYPHLYKNSTTIGQYLGYYHVNDNNQVDVDHNDTLKNNLSLLNKANESQFHPYLSPLVQLLQSQTPQQYYQTHYLSSLITQHSFDSRNGSNNDPTSMISISTDAMSQQSYFKRLDQLQFQLEFNRIDQRGQELCQIFSQSPALQPLQLTSYVESVLHSAVNGSVDGTNEIHQAQLLTSQTFSNIIQLQSTLLSQLIPASQNTSYNPSGDNITYTAPIISLVLSCLTLPLTRRESTQLDPVLTKLITKDLISSISISFPHLQPLLTMILTKLTHLCYNPSLYKMETITSMLTMALAHLPTKTSASSSTLSKMIAIFNSASFDQIHSCSLQGHYNQQSGEFKYQSTPLSSPFEDTLAMVLQHYSQPSSEHLIPQEIPQGEMEGGAISPHLNIAESIQHIIPKYMFYTQYTFLKSIYLSINEIVSSLDLVATNIVTIKSSTKSTTPEEGLQLVKSLLSEIDSNIALLFNVINHLTRTHVTHTTPYLFISDYKPSSNNNQSRFVIPPSLFTVLQSIINPTSESQPSISITNTTTSLKDHIPTFLDLTSPQINFLSLLTKFFSPHHTKSLHPLLMIQSLCSLQQFHLYMVTNISTILNKLQPISSSSLVNMTFHYTLSDLLGNLTSTYTSVFFTQISHRFRSFFMGIPESAHDPRVVNLTNVDKKAQDYVYENILNAAQAAKDVGGVAKSVGTTLLKGLVGSVLENLDPSGGISDILGQSSFNSEIGEDEQDNGFNNNESLPYLPKGLLIPSHPSDINQSHPSLFNTIAISLFLNNPPHIAPGAICHPHFDPFSLLFPIYTSRVNELREQLLNPKPTKTQQSKLDLDPISLYEENQLSFFTLFNPEFQHGYVSRDSDNNGDEDYYERHEFNIQALPSHPSSTSQKLHLNQLPTTTVIDMLPLTPILSTQRQILTQQFAQLFNVFLKVALSWSSCGPFAQTQSLLSHTIGLWVNSFLSTVFNINLIVNAVLMQFKPRTTVPPPRSPQQQSSLTQSKNNQTNKSPPALVAATNPEDDKILSIFDRMSQKVDKSKPQEQQQQQQQQQRSSGFGLGLFNFDLDWNDDNAEDNDMVDHLDTSRSNANKTNGLDAEQLLTHYGPMLKHYYTLFSEYTSQYQHYPDHAVLFDHHVHSHGDTSSATYRFNSPFHNHHSNTSTVFTSHPSQFIKLLDHIFPPQLLPSTVPNHLPFGVLDRVSFPKGQPTNKNNNNNNAENHTISIWNHLTTFTSELIPLGLEQSNYDDQEQAYFLATIEWSIFSFLSMLPSLFTMLDDFVVSQPDHSMVLLQRQHSTLLSAFQCKPTTSSHDVAMQLPSPLAQPSSQIQPPQLPYHIPIIPHLTSRQSTLWQLDSLTFLMRMVNSKYLLSTTLEDLRGQLDGRSGHFAQFLSSVKGFGNKPLHPPQTNDLTSLYLPFSISTLPWQFAPTCQFIPSQANITSSPDSFLTMSCFEVVTVLKALFKPSKQRNAFLDEVADLYFNCFNLDMMNIMEDSDGTPMENLDYYDDDEHDQDNNNNVLESNQDKFTFNDDSSINNTSTLPKHNDTVKSNNSHTDPNDSQDNRDEWEWNDNVDNTSTQPPQPSNNNNPQVSSTNDNFEDWGWN